MAAEDRPDLQEALRAYGKEEILGLLAGAGYVALGNRFPCPFPGCSDQGRDGRKRNCAVFASGRGAATYRVRCHRCSEGGTYLDVLMAVKGLTLNEAVAEVTGAARPAAPKVVRLAPKERPVEDGKLAPVEIMRAWDAMVADDERGRTYLEGRGLADAIGAGLVRFVTGDHPNPSASSSGKRGYRVGVLCRDVLGEARGIQFRLTRDPLGQDPKILSLRGSSTSRSFFGSPHLIESSQTVFVAEGLADTLAVAGWAKDGVVVGGPGKDSLPRLGEELVAAGVPLEGKVFVLFVQNDRPQNKSRHSFTKLARILTANLAHVVWASTNPEYKDVADWLHAHPEAEWPPAELARYTEEGPDQEDDSLGVVTPEGCGLPLPKAITTEKLVKNFTTLCALLDDPIHRESIVQSADRFRYCEMTDAVLIGDRYMSNSDWGTLRLRLEMHTESIDGKAIKFTPSDIEQAVLTIARKHPVHRVREYLEGLRWDGEPRIDRLAEFLGADSDLAKQCLRKWMIGVVARPMKPGCKMDVALILTGSQGIGKSTFFKILGGSWFTDSAIDIHSKDGPIVMKRSWIMEWAELESMKRARDSEQIKAFLTQGSDNYRAPYAKQAIDVARTCVIVGTTNQDTFLADWTGSRRFWVVKMTKRVDREWLHDNRDQLFAEAMTAYREGEAWWLDEAGDSALKESNEEYETVDAWMEKVVAFLGGRTHDIGAAELLEDGIKKPAGQWTHVDTMRMTAVMARLGWKSERKRIGDGSERKTRVYVKKQPWNP